QYYQELIKLRKEHPAFRMKTAGDVARHLVFDKKENRPGVITYMLKDNANGDSWKEIMLVFNGNDAPVDVNVPKADWLVVAQDGRLVAKGLGKSSGGKMSVAPCSALILAREK
ncbi:alpha-1,6-glucosidase domain-containing protein, partial [uncultured Muribaculum sp.]